MESELQVSTTTNKTKHQRIEYDDNHDNDDNHNAADDNDEDVDDDDDDDHDNNTTTNNNIQRPQLQPKPLKPFQQKQYHNNQDITYTNHIASKSIARAALHLGIEHITNDVLYVLSDALLLYMDRIGHYISTFVECDGFVDNYYIDFDRSSRSSSRSTSSKNYKNNNKKMNNPNNSKRWSGHVNIFDILHGIECCTSHAVHQVSMDSNNDDDNNNNDDNNNDNNNGNDMKVVYNHWEGLAEFLFGKDWLNIDINENNINNQKSLLRNATVQSGGVHGGGDDDNGNGSSDNPNPNESQPAETISNTIGAKGSNKSVGKQLMNTTNSDNDDDLNENQQDKNNTHKGWNAPYPEIVPLYPIRIQPKTFDSIVNANQACRDNTMSIVPSKLSKTNDHVAKVDQHIKDMEESINLIPDQVFQDGITSFWGVVSSSSITTDSQLHATSTEGDGNVKSHDVSHPSTSTDLSSSNKRKRGDDNDNNDVDNNISSKEKTTNILETNQKDKKDENTPMPSYVPNFLPPFPPKHTYLPIKKTKNKVKPKMKKVKMGMEETLPFPSTLNTTVKASLPQSYNDHYPQSATQHQNNIRSALVTLGEKVGKSYWGGIPLRKKTNNDSISSLKVQTVKIESFSSSADTTTGNSSSNIATISGGPSNSGIVSLQDQNNKNIGGNVVPVKPMTKPSSTRTSRILEGSMDTSN